MEVNMRKEQALLLLVVAIGAWMAIGYWNDTYRRRGIGKPAKPYEPTAAYMPFLADPKADPGLGKDVFLEPSETRPLPPANLPFPPLDALPPIAVPLPVGQQAGAYSALRVELETVVVAEGKGSEARAPATPVNSANGGQNTAGVSIQDPLSPEQLARRYDRLISTDGYNKRWGFFVGPDDLKYKLANSAGPYSEKISIRFRWIDERTGKQVGVANYPGNEVKQLELARTIKNVVECRDRKVPWTPTGLTQQVEFLRWMIEEGRREPWVFTKAMLRANKHIECAHYEVDAYRIKKRILRAKGDLEGEWELYQELPEKLVESAFRYQGMGELQAMLGLRKLAESNLRKAVELGPADPRTHGALTRFLLGEGHPGEAVIEADLAMRDRRRLEYPDERLELDRTVVGAHLAVGDVAGAKAALPANVPLEFTDQRRFLQACVDYADGDLKAARSDFEACAASGQVPDAAFGVAACQLRQGEVVAARDAFQLVAEQNPRLRHLALAGRGLALEHIRGEQAAALEALEAAQEANPQHPYVLYLLGRQRRRGGDLEGAVEVLKQALARRDDLKEALAELALSYQSIYHRDTDASALGHAVRYSDRLVASEAASLNGDHKPTVLYREMQGLFHFEAGDYRGARAAFEAGQQRSEFCKIGLAIVAYKQKRYAEARDILDDLTRHLPLRHPKRVFAEDLVARMDAHDNLEQVHDSFDGDHLPKSWHTEVEGSVHPQPRGGELRITGPLRGRAVVMAWRELPGTGRFVSLDLSLKSTGRPPAFVGLEINNLRRGRGAAQKDFVARFGFNEDGLPFLQIEDGRKPKPDEAEPVVFETATVHKDAMNHLRVEAVPQEGKEDSKTLHFRTFWNGELVHERKLRRLRRGSGGGTLNLELKVETRRRTEVDVAFDNFRLVQIRGD